MYAHLNNDTQVETKVSFNTKTLSRQSLNKWKRLLFDIPFLLRDKRLTLIYKTMYRTVESIVVFIIICYYVYF